MNSEGNTETILYLAPLKSINADGIRIVIKDNADRIIMENNYHYGYNCSYKRDFSSDRTPFVSDLLNDLCRYYQVDYIKLNDGDNTFNGSIEDKNQLEEYLDEVTEAKIFYN